MKERVRTEPAIRLYQKGLLSFGKAGELSGLHKWNFQEILAKENVAMNCDCDELEKKRKL